MSVTGIAIGTQMKTLVDAYIATLDDSQKQNISEAERLAAYIAMGEGIAPYVVQIGAFTPFAGSVLPNGWLWCDNASYERVGIYANLFGAIGTIWGSVDADHFNVPDPRGIALMGAGTSSKLVDANGVAFTRTLGTYQNDKAQGHKHPGPGRIRKFNNAGPSPWVVDGGANLATETWDVGAPKTDGVNGIPRTGAETNPANLGVNFIIKY